MLIGPDVLRYAYTAMSFWLSFTSHLQIARFRNHFILVIYQKQKQIDICERVSAK